MGPLPGLDGVPPGLRPESGGGRCDTGTDVGRGPCVTHGSLLVRLGFVGVSEGCDVGRVGLSSRTGWETILYPLSDTVSMFQCPL